GVDQIEQQLGRAVDRVMTEGSLYDRELAALAIKQAAGDLIEAIFLIRAYRTTLPRFGYSEPLDMNALRARRRISATFKDLPGGQVLGPTFDYTHRLLDFDLTEGRDDASGSRDGINPNETTGDVVELPVDMPRVLGHLSHEGLIETPLVDDDTAEVGDITRQPQTFPADRDVRLQTLARGDEGYLLSLGYSTQRGYGRTHPFAGEIRLGEVDVEFQPEDLDFPIVIGEVTVTECEMINQFKGSATEKPKFTRGYGIGFGHVERKAMAMALVDRSLRSEELGEDIDAPAQDQEFVLSHSDNVEATGFVEHLKLPHYVDFQSELELVRKMRAAIDAQTPEAAE
ncbi:MAG: carbon-phosphorus lyase complex subunit PhnI, partial [Cytophagales bacterium]|nr:carbon-phosphorus lyase complex subunit PhnI [Cytophagales bacterium]